MSRTLHTASLVAWLTLTVLSTSVSAQPSISSAPAVPVQVAAVSREQMTARQWVTGTITSRGDVRVAAEVAGRLEWVVDAGEKVAEGDVVARIDSAAWQLQLKENEATIRRLETSLAHADRQLARTRQLTEQAIAAASQLEEVESQRDMIEQDLVQARVAREQTLFRLGRTEVRAPFAGRVVERLEQRGGYVAAGREIIRLVDVRHTEVRAFAPLSLVPYVREGMTVVVREASTGREATGRELRVSSVIPVGDERSRMFEIRVDSSASPWLVGSAVEVAVPSGEPRHVVSVPRDALVLRSNEVYVLRVTAEGVVERVAVATGDGDQQRIEVEGDLTAGDRVVVRGAERLRPGQAVDVLADG